MRGTIQNVPGTFQHISEDRTSTNNHHPLEQRSQAYDPRPQNASHTIIGGCDTESRWLLVCAKGKKRPTTLSQLDMCATPSDKELFMELKKAYVGLRGRWTHILSLKKVQSIRFVQFELHIRDLVDIRKVPDMPPETKKDEYLYQPYDLVPPVGENLMAHLFHHPEDANDTSITCLRAPKKRKVKLTVCPRQGTSVGWGVHLVEGSLVFGICWTVFRHDVQGAFSVAAYMVTLIGTVVGTLQAGLG
uniref:Putative transcription factor n=1 Tax=Cladonia uncialis subsp. uncialis TaxID=180999 RepID=A0A2K9YDI4_CLAUC|nr:putative transcription factor [Cladonia uncialis subsp. uncialis]